jgi:hypothetical protein
MVIEVGRLAERNVIKDFVIVYGHGADVGYPGGQEVSEGGRREAASVQIEHDTSQNIVIQSRGLPSALCDVYPSVCSN